MRAARLVFTLVGATALSASGCAQQHGYGDDEPDPPSRLPIAVPPTSSLSDAGARQDARPGSSNDAASSLPGTFPFSLDAGWWLDEAGVIHGQPRPEGGWLLDDASAPDGGVVALPDWQPAQIERAVVVSGPCTIPPPAQTTGSDCRPTGWFSPACYRPPAECAALQESNYCVVASAGRYTYLGVHSGSMCWTDVAIPRLPRAGSVARIDGDLYACVDGIVKQVALSDGSFDTAPVPCSAVFNAGSKLLVHGKDSPGVTSFDSWAALKSARGRVLGLASHGALFGANETLMVVMWPEANHVDIVNLDGGHRIRVPLLSFQGPALSIDISDDGTLLFVMTSQGMWTFRSLTGYPMRRTLLATPGALTCTQPPSSAPSAYVAGSPRPGITSFRSTFVLQATQCSRPLEQPRYIANQGGPELFMLTGAGGDNRVDDQRSTPHTLVLHSAVASRWQLTLQPQTRLEKILLSGSAQSSVSVLNGTVPIEQHVGSNALGDFGSNWFTPEATMLRARVELLTERALTEIYGCNAASAQLTISNAAPLCAMHPD